MRVVRNKDIIKRFLHDGYFLIDITESYRNNKCTLYEINEVGAFLWDRIDELRSLEKLCTALHSEISDNSVSLEQIKTDVEDYLYELLELGFVMKESE